MLDIKSVPPMVDDEANGQSTNERKISEQLHLALILSFSSSTSSLQHSTLDHSAMQRATLLMRCLAVALFVCALCVAPLTAADAEPETTAPANYSRPTSRDELLRHLGKNIHAMQLVKVQPLTPQEERSVRVLCWVNTYHKNHATRLQAIKRTWGKKCDKLVFMSDIEDKEIPTIRITAPPLHETLWQKHREIVRLLLREFRDDEFDWVFKGDDDTFLFVENLKKYLLTPEIQRMAASQPMILGHRMTLQWWEMQRPFNPFENHHPDNVVKLVRLRDATMKQGGLYYTPGGGGYAMNWAYLKKLEASFEEPYCLPNEVVPDDWAISFCMWHHNVTPLDTRDALQRERFHQYDPVDLYFKPHDDQAFDHSVYDNVYEENNWFSDHFGIGWKNGDDCCAPDSISFHYVKPPLMEYFYDYYYDQPE